MCMRRLASNDACQSRDQPVIRYPNYSQASPPNKSLKRASLGHPSLNCDDNSVLLSPQTKGGCLSVEGLQVPVLCLDEHDHLM